jgi:hypothetical protein
MELVSELVVYLVSKLGPNIVRFNYNSVKSPL